MARCEKNLNDGIPPNQCSETLGVVYLKEDDGWYCPRHKWEILEEIREATHPYPSPPLHDPMTRDW